MMWIKTLLSGAKQYLFIGLGLLVSGLLIAVKILTAQNSNLRKKVEVADAKIKHVKVVVVAGCGTTVIGYDGPCPLRPALEPIPVEMQVEIAPHALEIIAENQLKLKRHIKDLEALSGCVK
jgi:hypothetical protein